MDNGLTSAHTGNVSTSSNPATAQDAAPDGASVTGTVTAWFKWNGAGTPKPLYALLNATAAGNPVPGVSSVTVDDGLGDAPVSNQPPGLPGPTYVSSSGRHLKPSSGSAGSGGMASVSVTLSATGSGFANVFASLSASPDTRGVTLTRSGTPAWNTGPTLLANGEICGEWVDPDGTAHGDTTYSYQQTIIDSGYAVSQGVINNQTFNAMFSGSWSMTQGYNDLGNYTSIPNVTWVRSPQRSSATWDQNVWSIRNGQRILTQTSAGDWWAGPVDTPITLPMTYTATDKADGASATAVYQLTIHDPIEISAASDGKSTQLQSLGAVGPWVYSSANGSTLSLPVTSSVPYSLETVANDVYARWAADVLDINLSTTASGNTPSGYTITASGVPAGYGTYAAAYSVSDVHTGVAFLWVQSGYAGTTRYTLTAPSASPTAIVPAPYQQLNVPPLG